MNNRDGLIASRRNLLRGAVGGALGIAVAGRIESQTALAQTPVASPVAPSTAVELPQPKSLKSADGALNVTLTAMPGVVDMGAPQPVTTYTYDGVVPGFTWDVQPGDTLKIDLVNNLPALTGPMEMTMTRPHMWTTTNLHTHGLHVSPSGNSDNVFLEIAPGASQHYEIPIPTNHTGGTFWYHPHKHGAVCQQVRAGMAGALIVRGEIDKVPEIAAAKEQIMVLQAIELGDDYQLLDPIPDPTTKQAFFPRTQILYTVNGVVNPKITMHPGEVQRWRLLNAAEARWPHAQCGGLGWSDDGCPRGRQGRHALRRQSRRFAGQGRGRRFVRLHLKSRFEPASGNSGDVQRRHGSRFDGHDE
jgi:FtsP/CotA-like multicopper oxidase with cupredoxin domain